MAAIESLHNLGSRGTSLGPSRDDLRKAWGVTPSYSFWPVPIRILFVIDGRINLTADPSSFGLGYVLDTLLTPFSWWVRFEIDIAKRDGPLGPEALGSHTLLSDNFKFTQAGFNIDAFDQVWLFGDVPSADTGADSDIPALQLDDAELKVLAEWMDRGGGVFAAGDHSILGASMCSRVPRVRTMRKWTQAQGVPTKTGSQRHQTLQVTGASQDRQEEDTLLQPIEVVYRDVGGTLAIRRRRVPHPLLCTTRGVIDRFPDHMHEGEVIADDNVQLDQPLNIPGYDREEYPFEVPVVLGGPVLGGSEVLPRPRPRPHVIAFGRTTNDALVPPVIASIVEGSHLPLFGKRFGLISVYDGDSVGLGRVVVDSTWHHWFSMNLDGIHSDNIPAFEQMQAYYRNVGMWLATPAQRASMLVSGAWGVLNGSAPMAFGADTGSWEIADRVLSVFGITAPTCMIDEFVAPFYDQALAVFAAPSGEPQPEPPLSVLPEDLPKRAVVGGIGSALLELALDLQERVARGERPRLDSEAIRRRAVTGAAHAHALLREVVAEAATSLAAASAQLAASPAPRSVDVLVPVEIRQLRVSAGTLQLPDATDPALLDRQLTLTLQIKLDDAIVAHEVIEAIELSSFDERGAIVDLRRTVGSVAVQTGESLTIELRVGAWYSGRDDPEALRFQDVLRGDASTWLGQHTPARSQPWRLWYTIEESGGSSQGA